ncbi:unnamed protein product [Durusdinium trenchii]|uniref:Uncharacterized protein n=1 Tax=Durusdinium trenchii TaxID=1381693 RepID=A0ABP0QT85_9DINO
MKNDWFFWFPDQWHTFHQERKPVFADEFKTRARQPGWHPDVANTVNGIMQISLDFCMWVRHLQTTSASSIMFVGIATRSIIHVCSISLPPFQWDMQARQLSRRQRDLRR